MSFLMYRLGTDDWSAVSDLQEIQQFHTTAHRPERTDGDFGDLHFSSASLSKDGRLILKRFVRLVKDTDAVYDTMFAGTFDPAFDTLRGILILTDSRKRVIVFAGDKKYVDTEGRIQDSLIKTFQSAVIRDDRRTVASFITYPFQLNRTSYRGAIRLLKIQDQNQFLRKYDQIFKPRIRNALLTLVGPIWYGGRAWGDHNVISHGVRWQGAPVTLFCGCDTNPPKLEITDLNIEKSLEAVHSH
ncbi:MAG: hypothetical protein Q8922_13420 [Bacteroidota bacterium]|nr:hypothetical protein [Bacteroidota bacterium]MDP4233866.1 hypothetical protein [Bacteroidota bacterium]MDP4243539.1 hypothetical protein [Bacteroidota bacterium]MDP4288922.1 hypothetical protein [Bacteroidota bacterium]